MPNRVIKESIKRSPQIDSLTWFEEVVFYRLIVSADDYGCYDGRIVVIKNELFPTKENITSKSISDAIDKLAKVGLLCKYTVSDMPYLFFPSWEKHQRVRNKRRKYPEPPADINLTASCGELRRVAADCGLNPIQSESNPNPIQSEDESNARPRADATAQPAGRNVFNKIINSGGDLDVAAVFQAYDQKIGGQMNDEIRDGLIYYIKQMGAECCILAMDEAIASNVLNWRYVKTVLQNKLKQGVHSKADWDAVDAKRDKQKVPSTTSSRKTFSEIIAEREEKPS